MVFIIKIMIVVHEFRVLISEACGGLNMFVELCIPIPSVFTIPFDFMSKEESVIEKMAPLNHFEV